jgi:hypothetical protein
MLNVAEEMKRLNQIAKRHPGQIRKPLWKLLATPEWLAQAWEEIRRNKGSQTAGVDNTTAVDVDLDLIHKLAEELKNGTYYPKPVRRVRIPKADGKTRPLGISTIKDRIVQQGLKMLLEPIFEADFYDCSHGFRQGRSTITALRDVVRHYGGVSWIIEGDIEGCYILWASADQSAFLEKNRNRQCALLYPVKQDGRALSRVSEEPPIPTRPPRITLLPAPQRRQALRPTNEVGG